MSPTPTVSVILPNYNYAAYLDRRIGSILSQSFRDFELIILDDASTDDSLDVIARYRDDPRVSRVVVNDTNTGSPFAQWQRGISLARGRYVWIAEADDMADPAFLDTCVGLMEANPHAALCFTNAHIIGPDDRPSTAFSLRNTFPRHIDHGNITISSRDFVDRHLYWHNYVYNASAVLFRRDAVTGIDPSLWTAMRHTGDYMFWVEVARRGDVIAVYDKLNYFRRHDSSTTRAGGASGLGTRELLEVSARLDRIVKPGKIKQMVRNGRLLRIIRRCHTPAQQAALMDLYNTLFDHPRLSHLLYRLNQNLLAATPLSIGPTGDRMIPR